MSLVLTEVSCYGVTMAADSAVTFDDGRILVGFQKLLPVPHINAGLSIWGLATINEIDADVWLQRFIEKEIVSNMRLWGMACKLANKLNEEFNGVAPDRMGIHVGGFDIKNGIRGPAFYHVHNGHYHLEFKNGCVEEIAEEDPPIREFRAHEDHPPKSYTLSDGFPMTRNGDFSIFVLLFDNLLQTFRRIQEMTALTFPFPSNLDSRGEYLRFWINLTKEVYRLSNYRQRVLPEPVMSGDAHIGGPVIVLTISNNGIASFYSK